MKTPSRPFATLGYFKFLILIGVFALGMAAFAAPFYTARSHALPQASSPPIDNASNQSSSRFGINFLLPQAAAPAIATFDGTCATADSDFNIGQTVCGRATFTGGSASGRRITWVDPQGYVRQSTPITDETQDDTFAIPSDPTTTLSNGQEVSNIGKWRVNIVNRRGALVTYAIFLVKDPANGRADLAIFKRAPGDAERLTPGSISTFQIYIENYGPDDAANVVVTDRVPANTTFVSMVQTSATPTPEFNCDTVPDANGDVRCTISSLASGATATFDVAFTIDTGVAAGTSITNTATVSSATSDGTASDNSSSATITVAGGGGSGTCSLDCPPNINTQADTTDANNNPGAIVHFDQPTTEGTCGTITTDHCNDCFFPVGTTVVTFSSTTGDSCQFAVTVSPASNAPTISCPSNKEVDAMGDCSAVVDVGTATATGGENVTIFATRSDGKPMYNCDANGQNCVRQNPDYPFSGGNTTITWTATSHNAAGEDTGNSSCVQTITVNNASEDTTAPVITCPANITTDNDAGQCSAVINVGTATASDNCSDAEVVGTRSDNQPLDAPYPKGTTTITWTATDASGNSSSCDQTVTVNDAEAPVITCPANVTTTTDPGSCSAVVNPGTPTATDNCGAPTIVGTRSDGQPLNAPYPKGTTTIHWTATDDANNSSSCDQTVTVNDEEPPTISCPADITVYLAPNSTATTAVVNYTTPVGQDNCGGSTTTLEAGLASGSAFPVGTTTVTFRVTDASGNYAECSFTVTVLYNFTGFFSPIHNPPTFNNVNAGRAIPVKFSLSGNKGLNIFAPGYPVSQQIACDTSAPLSDVEGTETSGGSTLTYSPDQYHYNWKTESSWAGTCRKLIVKLNDGTEHTALFKFK